MFLCSHFAPIPRLHHKSSMLYAKILLVLFLAKAIILSNHSGSEETFHDQLQVLNEVVSVGNLLGLQRALGSDDDKGWQKNSDAEEDVLLSVSELENSTINDSLNFSSGSLTSVYLSPSEYLESESLVTTEFLVDPTGKSSFKTEERKSFEAENATPSITVDRLENLERLLEKLIGIITESNKLAKTGIPKGESQEYKSISNQKVSISASPTPADPSIQTEMLYVHPNITTEQSANRSEISKDSFKFEEPQMLVLSESSRESQEALQFEEQTGHSVLEVGKVKDPLELATKTDVKSNLYRGPFDVEISQSEVVFPIAFTTPTSRHQNHVLTKINSLIGPHISFDDHATRSQSKVFYGKPKVAWYGPQAPKATLSRTTDLSTHSLPTKISIQTAPEYERFESLEDNIDVRSVIPIVKPELKRSFSGEFASMTDNLGRSSRNKGLMIEETSIVSASKHEYSFQSKHSWILNVQRPHSLGGTELQFTSRKETNHTSKPTTRTKLSRANFDQFPLLFNEEREKRRKGASFFHIERTMENVAVTFAGYSSIVAAVIFAIFVTFL